MKTSYKAFAIGFVMVFTMIIMQKSGLFNINLIGPATDNTQVMDIIKPKLNQKPNNYSLKKPLALTQTAYASSSQDYDKASAYIVVDFNTGEILKSKNSTQKLPIASLTKVMTAVTALDLIPSTQQLLVDEDAAHQIPTKLVLTPGEKLTLEEALNASLLTSTNDTTQLIKNGVNDYYNSQIFIQSMNEKARSIGLKNSSFTNPQGFDDPKNYSTVEDLATLSHYALTNYPLIANIAQKPSEDLPATQTHKEFYLNNWQGLIGVYPGTTGLKIGNTDNAKYTTIVVSQREGHKLIAILLGAPGVLERDLWTAQLLDDTFQEQYNLTPIKVTQADLRAKYATWKYFN